MHSFIWLFPLLITIMITVVRRDEKDWEQVKATLRHPHQSFFQAYEHPPHDHETIG